MKNKFNLNLPKTNFPMRANLVKNELKILNKWIKDDLYNILIKKRKNKKIFILHDGPPYANGNIHIGHAINKVLKDIIIKFKTISGFKVSFIPGWDCHGLPIEQKIEQKFKNLISIDKLRKKCKKFALSQVKKQKKDFIRIGIISDWNNPYLTMDYNIQANIIKVLYKIFKKGYLIRKKKPIYWCFKCKSSLSESEIEYYYKKIYSSIIFYKIKNINFIRKIFNYKKIKKVSILVYNSEIWTLPSTVGILVNPNINYKLVKFNNKYYILSKDYIKNIINKYKIRIEVLNITKGINLEFIKIKNLFSKKNLIIILNKNILNIETGFLNLIPSHNQNDYEISKKYNIKIKNLVNSNNYYLFKLLKIKFNILKINKILIKILKKNIFDLFSKKISYPYCWRHKKPTIFISKTQWFININHKNLKNKLLKEIKKVNWIPNWGKKKMKYLIKNRPDWCISRQRYWGVPIPILINKKKNTLHSNNFKIIKEIYNNVKKHGVDFYWNLKLKDIIKNHEKYKKNLDVLEVWFDSGCTHYTVIKKRLKNKKSNIYLEGSDQYRGWFMSSLIISVIINNKSPYDKIITHGFVVDKNGKKMSKSEGNVITPQEIINKYGADILRLWISSIKYKSEMLISDEVLNRSIDIYRKIRNTIRYMISNLNDFNIIKNEVNFKDMVEIDKWIIHHTKLTQKLIISFYSKYRFHKIIKILMKFCSVYLSSFYLDIIKDRQYTNKKNSLARRSSQTAIFYILECIVRWISPILSFTSDEIWSYLPNRNSKYVFTENWYDKIKYLSKNRKINYRYWIMLFKLKKKINKLLEKYKIKNKINSSLELMLIFFLKKKMLKYLNLLGKELRYVFIISSFKIKYYKKANKKSIKIRLKSIEKFKILILKAKGKKCSRCWHFFSKINIKYLNICKRCLNNLYKKGEIRKYV